MNRTLIWLDDERNPDDPKWQAWQVRWSPIGHIGVDVVWLKSHKELVIYLASHKLPDAICFDHDLGEGPSGYDSARYICDYCMSEDLPIPFYYSQSSNPAGKANILGLLDSYRKFYEEKHN